MPAEGQEEVRASYWTFMIAGEPRRKCPVHKTFRIRRKVRIKGSFHPTKPFLDKQKGQGRMCGTLPTPE